MGGRRGRFVKKPVKDTWTEPKGEGLRGGGGEVGRWWRENGDNCARTIHMYVCT